MGRQFRFFTVRIGNIFIVLLTFFVSASANKPITKPNRTELERNIKLIAEKNR